MHHSASLVSSGESDGILSDTDDDTPITPARTNISMSKMASHVVSEKKHKRAASYHMDRAETVAQVSDFLQQKALLDRERLQLSMKQDQRREDSARAKQEQANKKTRLAMAQSVLAMQGASEEAKAKANQVILSLLDD